MNVSTFPIFFLSYRLREQKRTKTGNNSESILPTTTVCVFQACSDSCSSVVVAKLWETTGISGISNTSALVMPLHYKQDTHCSLLCKVYSPSISLCMHIYKAFQMSHTVNWANVNIENTDQCNFRDSQQLIDLVMRATDRAERWESERETLVLWRKVQAGKS